MLTTTRTPGPVYEPTPEEIAKSCAEIRAKWSEKEEAKRFYIKQSEPLSVPEIDMSPGKYLGKNPHNVDSESY